MALADVEFTDEEMETTVEPVMEVVDALVDALMVTIPTPGSENEVRKAWRLLADKVLRFVKEEPL